LDLYRSHQPRHVTQQKGTSLFSWRPLIEPLFGKHGFHIFGVQAIAQARTRHKGSSVVPTMKRHDLTIAVVVAGNRIDKHTNRLMS